VWVDKHHSVSDARGKVTVTNGTQRLLGAVIGKDPDTVLAVIRADHTLEVKPLVLRTSPARLGELCFALGAPLGEFADTMSMGIVSGLNRRLAQGQGRVIEDVLQTDAAINHGNSGGPLVDIDGSILGVNTAGIDDAHNIGFAVPSHTVADIVPELLEAGAITRATIGAKLEIRRAASSGADELVVLETVDESSPLRAGDIIREFNGQPLKRRADLMKLLRRDVIAREVPLVIERNGKAQGISITPQKRRR